MPDPVIRLLESPEDMTSVEELQRAVWPGSETDVVPAHMLITATHNGGLVIGAFLEDHAAVAIGALRGSPTPAASPMARARSTVRT